MCELLDWIDKKLGEWWARCIIVHNLDRTTPACSTCGGSRIEQSHHGDRVFNDGVVITRRPIIGIASCSACGGSGDANGNDNDDDDDN